MKKIFATVIMILAVVSANAYDKFNNNDMWGNSRENEDQLGDAKPSNLFSDESLFSSNNWLSGRPETDSEWDIDDNLGENDKPAIPTGEGTLFLLLAAGGYVVSKLRRKE